MLHRTNLPLITAVREVREGGREVRAVQSIIVVDQLTEVSDWVPPYHQPLSAGCQMVQLFFIEHHLRPNGTKRNILQNQSDVQLSEDREFKY